MEEAVDSSIDNEGQFWIELKNILASPGRTHESIDDTLRAFLELISEHKQTYLSTEYEVVQCCYELLDSPTFTQHTDYVRHQILYCLLQEEEVDVLHVSAAVLLHDGRTNEGAFETMQKEGAFQRLVELIRARTNDGQGLHRVLLELLFEMSRVQKLTRDDLTDVDDSFILYLFELIEQLSDDADDPYHYHIIRVLLVLNEQYMCIANYVHPNDEAPVGVTNRILKLLSLHGPSYRTFGENLILLLNRETELGPQLLILKLLYLLFTTPATFEYFYTNDLHVLVDVIIRNLLDLDPGAAQFESNPDGAEQDGQTALRHTYLRVLCPLLKNTQLGREGNNYKRQEVRRLLYLLVYGASAHFAPVDETVVRLVLRCRQIAWVRDESDAESDRELEGRLEQQSHITPADVAKKLLGMSINTASQSNLSVNDVSAKITKQKPNVPAPRRNRKVAKSDATESRTNGESIDNPNFLKAPQHNAQDSGISLSPIVPSSPFADDNVED